MHAVYNKKRVRFSKDMGHYTGWTILHCKNIGISEIYRDRNRERIAV